GGAGAGSADDRGAGRRVVGVGRRAGCLCGALPRLARAVLRARRRWRVRAACGEPVLMARRIVTGHDSNGKSVIVSDAPTPTVRELPDDGARFFDIWATSASPAPVTPVEAREPTGGESLVAPPAGGSVVRIVELEPGGASPMHRTETVDYGILLEGELFMVLDSGDEVKLAPGDVVVQRGTDHAWQNRSDAVARMAFVLLDGEFSDELRGLAPGPY